MISQKYETIVGLFVVASLAALLIMVLIIASVSLLVMTGTMRRTGSVALQRYFCGVKIRFSSCFVMAGRSPR